MFDSQLLHASVARNVAVSAGVDRRKQELERDKWKAAAARRLVWEMMGRTGDSFACQTNIELADNG